MEKLILWFSDGLSGFRNLSANVLKERSGLIPTVVAVINNILVPIRKMQMTMVEYVLLQAIILFDPGLYPVNWRIRSKYKIYLECLALTQNGQEAVNEKRTALLGSLRKHLDSSMSKVESAYRFAAILLRVSQCHVSGTLNVVALLTKIYKTL